MHNAGWSNVATAVAGAGFTGSYIFSQTIFTMRSGVHSRINGYAIALMMLAIFAAPFSVIEYLPSYFFGSLMIWIGYEIARVCFWRCIHWDTHRAGTPLLGSVGTTAATGLKHFATFAASLFFVYPLSCSFGC